MGFKTHDTSVSRRVLYRCATTNAHLWSEKVSAGEMSVGNKSRCPVQGIPKNLHAERFFDSCQTVQLKLKTTFVTIVK